MRVVLADDHTLVRAGIRSLLEAVAGVEVAGEAGDGREALLLVDRLRPHVAVLDIRLPAMNGLDVAARLAHTHPETRVLVLSMHANEEYVRQALHAGAAGYLLKDCSVTELELALRAVARGETYLSPPVSRLVVDDYLRHEAPPQALSLRQREVLQLIAEGHSTKEIAHRLGVSVKTAESHRFQIMSRLEIRDVPGLVRYAIRTGLVGPEA